MEWGQGCKCIFVIAQHENNFYSFLARAGKSEHCSEPDYLAAIYILSSLAEDHPVIENAFILIA